jgi:hypothetical protein
MRTVIVVVWDMAGLHLLVFNISKNEYDGKVCDMPVYTVIREGRVVDATET